MFTKSEVMSYYIKGRIDALETFAETFKSIFNIEITEVIAEVIEREKEKYEQYKHNGI